MCLSFLNTRDFLRAICVSKQFRAARTRRSAWPQAHIPTLIRALQDDDYDNPARRRLMIDKPVKLTKVLQPACKQMWRHVTDIRLVGGEQRLKRLLDFPCMAALTLNDSIPSINVTNALYTGLADRLQALGLSLCSDPLYSQLGLLTQLRILVLDRPPDAAALVQLAQLEYLHMETHDKFDCSPVLMCVVRWLSVHHQLRSLSLHSYGSWKAFRVEELIESDPLKSAIASAEWVSLSAHPPLDLTVKCGLTDLSLSGEGALRSLQTSMDLLCRGLPHLTRLQWPEQAGPQLLTSVDLRSNARELLPRSQEARIHFNNVSWKVFNLTRPLR